MLRHRAILVLALSIAGCGLTRPDPIGIRSIGAAPAPTEARGYYALGKQQLAAGNLGLAVDYLRKAVRETPDSIDALNALGVAYDRLGRYDLSRNRYEAALALDPNAAFVLNNLGYSLVLQGKVDEGRILLAQAGRLADPDVQVASSAILAKLPGAPAARAPVEPEAAVRPWIERSNAGEQTLVLTPRADVVRMAAALRVEPGVISAAGGAAPSAPSGARIDLPSALLTRWSHEEQLAAGTLPAPRAVAVINGVGRARMAARVGEYLSSKGIAIARLGNAPSFKRRESELVFGPADRAAAQSLAASLPFGVRMVEQPTAPAVRLVLGQDAVEFDRRLVKA